VEESVSKEAPKASSVRTERGTAGPAAAPVGETPTRESMSSDGIGFTPTRIIQVLDRVIALASEFELQGPPDVLLRFRKRLESNTFQVLVIGEAKRGKSTFINALIGRDILPTDVDIATSQVFKVSRGAEEIYRLRFEDDSTRRVQGSDLASYGSQVVVDAQGQPKLDQTIRWIEVDVPARFIPPNITILDTPGLGGLYAAHAQITYRFLAYADAVIFVLDSGQPVGAAELDLMGKILDVTRKIFLIQTKIDQHGKDGWEQTIARNESIVADRFADRLDDVQIWPISSKNLRKAAGSTRPDALLMVSRYQALADALQAFLLQMSAAERAVEALSIACRFHIGRRQVLATRLRSLEDPDKTPGEEAARIATDKKRFEVEWGPRGVRRSELGNGARRVIAIGRQTFREALQPGGRVVGAIEHKIETMTPTQATSEFGTKLREELLEATLGEWESVRKLTESRLGELLNSFLDAAEDVGIPGDWKDEAISRSGLQVEKSVYEQVLSKYYAFIPVLGAAGFLGPFLTIPLGVWIFFQSKVRGKKEELRKMIRQELQDVQRHFLSADLTDSRSSRVDEYFKAVESSVAGAVDATVRRKLADLESEIARLQDQSLLQEKERIQAAEEARRQMAAWDALGRELLNLGKSDDLRNALERLTQAHEARSEQPRQTTIVS
jgi:GTPase SAR1 family protein